MDALSKLISSLATLAWPLVIGVLLYKLQDPIRTLIESARGRKFTIKVAGNELTMDEASEQLGAAVGDLQLKVAALEKRLSEGGLPGPASASILGEAVPTSNKRILWVDDNPKNNSFLVSALQERGARVDIALSTDAGLSMFRKQRYDMVLSDMGRPEGERAGLDLTRRIKEIRPEVPVYIYCGAWAATNLHQDALDAGVATITASSTTLLSALPLAD